MIFYKHFNEKDEAVMIPIYDNGFCMICANCGAEEALEDPVIGGLALDGDLESTSFYCTSCSMKGLAPKPVVIDDDDEYTSPSLHFKDETLDVVATTMTKDVLMLDVWNEDGNLTACLDQVGLHELIRILSVSLNKMHAEEQ